MELEQLKKTWQDHYKKEDAEEVNLDLLKTASIDRTRHLLGEHRTTALFELVVNAVFVFPTLGFVLDHLREPKFLIPGLILFIAFIWDVVLNALILRKIAGIRYETPITSIQKTVTDLRIQAIRHINQLYVAIPVMGLCFVIVGTRAILGLDLFMIGNVVLHLGIGTVVLTPLIVWFVKLFPDKRLEQAGLFLDQINDFKKSDG